MHRRWLTALLDHLLHHALVLKVWSPELVPEAARRFATRGEREINLKAKRKADGGEEAVSQSADLGLLEAR